MSRLQSVSVSQETHWGQVAAVVIIKCRGQVKKNDWGRVRWQMPDDLGTDRNSPPER